MRTPTLVLLAACSHAAITPAVAPAPASTPRFDTLVRQDFFDGIRGDTAALDRAMKLCEDALATNPRNAEAMVWHGAGLAGRSIGLFRAGDTAAGITMFESGIAQMDEAVALEPTNVGVRIPRGAAVLGMAPFVPEPEKSKLFARGVDDYEATLTKQAPYFTTLTLHAREQLLYGLTDGYANLGQSDKAQAMYARMEHDAAGSALLPRAKARAAGEAVAGPAPCQQCHGVR